MNFYILLLAQNSLSANPTKWSNTLKQLVGNLTTNCLSVFDHFVILALKELIYKYIKVAAFKLIPQECRFVTSKS